MLANKKIKVWDFFIRFFHWSLVTAFIVAYVTEDDFLTVHTWAGYLILGLLLARIIWGFVGTKSAKFSDFVYSFKTIKEFLADTLQLKAKRYLGHNPAGGLMVIFLILSLLATTITGVVLVEVTLSNFLLEVIEEVHEFFANFTLLLVFIHVAGVIVESFIHQENLVSAMITGLKRK
ncbi:MAG: cytochrome b/b6 domain-containing protein [Gammaproteobacteria bacterium]|nr:cytochrome b/b6 domain-containing protein [Gammaproteobacteria bacterium]